MRDTRQVGALPLALAGTAVLAGTVLAVPATAAPRVRTVCRLVTDPRGDAGTTAIPHVPGGATDDILSADVASDGRTVTAVLRMVDVQVPDPVAPAGRGYTFSFQLRGAPTTYFLTARTYATGTRYQYGSYAVDGTGQSYVRVLGEGTGKVSTTAHEVHVSAPAAAFRPQQVRRGAILVSLTARVYRWWGQGLVDDQDVGPVHVPLYGTGSTFDEALGDRYVVGTPSCVKLGA